MWGFRVLHGVASNLVSTTQSCYKLIQKLI